MSKLLEARKLCAYYGPTQVLFDIDFSLEPGQITAILGANGAGKTTTLRAICQMVRTSGNLEFSGQQLVGKATENVVRMGVAHVPDGRGTFTSLSVDDNLKLGAYVRGDRAEVARDIDRTYERFPRLAERRNQQAGTLSGGEQQMLAIGRALVADPEMILLDEPSLGLAPLIVRDIFQIVEQINRDKKVSILLVEQNAVMALKFASYGYVIENGRTVLEGSAAALSANEDIQKFYLGVDRYRW